MWEPQERLSFYFSIRSSAATWASLQPVATKMSALLTPQQKYTAKSFAGFYSFNLEGGCGGKARPSLQSSYLKTFCRT